MPTVPTVPGIVALWGLYLSSEVYDATGAAFLLLIPAFHSYTKKSKVATLARAWGVSRPALAAGLALSLTAPSASSSPLM